MFTQGFEPRGSSVGDLVQALTPYVVSNGVLVTAGNAVTLTNGYLDNLAAGERLLGVASKTMTGDSSSSTMGVYCDPDITYYNDASAALAQADVGKIYQTTVSSGKMKIDESTAASPSTGASYTASAQYAFILVNNFCPIRNIYKNLMRMFSEYLGNLSFMQYKYSMG